MEQLLLTRESLRNVATRAAEIVRTGGVVLHPADTVYGLACNACDAAAVARVGALKQRPDDMPFIVLGADEEQLAHWVEPLEGDAALVLRSFAPGPVTFVLRSSGWSRNNIVRCGATLAVRLPDHPFTQTLCALAGTPLLSTSANLHGDPVPGTIASVAPSIRQSVDLVVDGGEMPTLHSTIVDLTSAPPRILREGVVTRAMFRERLPHRIRMA